MIETHAHLNDPIFDTDRDRVIANAFEIGIAKIIEIADSPQDWEKALALTQSYPGRILCALGLHPHYALDWNENLNETLRRHLQSPQVAAIGEIGLDYAKSQAAPESQAKALIGMLKVANDAGKPIVLHCREGLFGAAHDDLFDILKDQWKPKTQSRFHGVMHCFSGKALQAQRAAYMRLALGVDGPVTYPKNDALRQILKSAGLNSLVLETDSPYLPPQSIRGQRNDPSRIPDIARELANIFQTTTEEIDRVTTQNARELFRF
ncbi:MAG: TatD family hydrolase [Elusimicrobiota bacterium]